MKELVIGDIAIYTEDGDSWDDLIKVVKKANQAYLECIKDLKPKKEKWVERLKKFLKNECSKR